MKQTYKEFADRLSTMKSAYTAECRYKNIKVIGNGVSRSTLVNNNWPFLVFKFDSQRYGASNKSEWHYYHYIASKRQKGLLARPYYISPNGIVLVMERIKVSQGLNKISYKSWKKLERNFPELPDKYDTHNVGSSGNIPKIFDYASATATWYNRKDPPGAEIYRYDGRTCQCEECNKQ